MRRGTIIVIVFIILAAAVVGLSQFFRAQPPLELTIAVSPLAERWVRASVDAFNATEPVVNATRRVRFTVVPIDDMSVWQDDRRAPWTPENHPAAWIPASSMSVTYARDTRFPVELVTPSLARTPLLWGGYVSRVDVLTENGALPLDWQAVAEGADTEAWASLPGGQSGWGFVKLAFDRPDQAVSGFGVLLSGAAAFADTAALTPTITNGREFRDWFEPIVSSVPNFNMGGDPAAAMASRGMSVAEIALLPESRWLTNLDGLRRNEDVRLAYPQYPFVFDFPLARWTDAATTPEEREAVDALSAWLLAAPRQEATVTYGLRPAQGAVAETATLFRDAVPYGVLLDPVFGDPLAPLSRNEAQRLLQWFSALR